MRPWDIQSVFRITPYVLHRKVSGTNSFGTVGDTRAKGKQTQQAQQRHKHVFRHAGACFVKIH